jgi:DNA polymerase elongation subunit (family B)
MKAYIYDWSHENLNNKTIIRIFCLNEYNNTVCLIIEDFLPYVYLELPNTITTNSLDSTGTYITDHDPIQWKQHEIESLHKEIQKQIFKQNSPVDYDIKNRKKLYYAHKIKTSKGFKDEYFKYLVYYFDTNQQFRRFGYKLNTTINVKELGTIPLKVHEYNVSPILQLVCQQDIQMSGWIEFDGQEMSTKESEADYEYVVSYADLRAPVEQCGNTPSPMVLSFDIEVYSSNPNRFPDANKTSDCIFQISCVYWRKDSGKIDNYLLTIGDVDKDIVTADEKSTVLCYSDEASLLLGFIELLHRYNPQLITGYNILGFDIDYMMTRSKKLMIESEFAMCGMIKHKQCEAIDDSWSSSAYGKQSFKYYTWDGRIIIDLLMFARREIKAENYKLETIASMFIKAHKDPLTHKDIFRGYEHGVLRVDEFKDEGIQLLSEVGKYCVKDSILVQRLFDEWDMWIGLAEMAAVCNVPASYLYTKGQQIKVFSQVYKYCYDNKIVVENNVYECKENERYQGAYVKEPVPGIYNYVVPFDFKSLYPTLIVAYNIDYSTFVVDDSIPDDMCHIIEWEEEHEYDVYTCTSCNQETRYLNERTDDRKKTIPKNYGITVVCEQCTHQFMITYQQLEEICARVYADEKKYKIRPISKVFIDKYRYRFLKNPKGVLPTVITNLLDARAKVRAHMKTLKKKLDTLSGDELTHTKNLINILNKRQLAYKVSANSMYGTLGVRRGMLPLMPGAMCVTAMGRYQIKRAAHYLIDKYQAKAIYGDTDSTYVQFPNIPPEELWAHSRNIEREMLRDKVFPEPMVLEFEDAIYNPFFILTKKRYMWRYYNEDGTHSTDVGNKGVVLARRGTSKFLKDVYEGVVNGIFEGWNKNTTLLYILDNMNKCCSSSLPIEDFIITKKVGDVDTYAKDRSLPAHVRLAETMRERGTRVDVGERLEYVVTIRGGLKGRVMEKAEDVEYQKRYSHIIPMDYLYYIHLIMKQVDELLTVAFKMDKFVDSQYKLRIKKYKLMDELKFYFRPKITFEERIYSKTEQ